MLNYFQNMKYLLPVLLLVSFTTLVGCAALKQVHSDAQVGLTAPLEAGELSPQEQASEVTGILQAVPVVGPFAPILGPLLVGIFGWQRGRRIRKALPVSSNPISGFLGNKVGIEAVIQQVTNVVEGLYEVGPENSGLKRAWKTGLNTLLAVGTGAMLVPDVQQFVVNNPNIVVGLTSLAALFGGLEKEASKVLPVKQPIA